MVSVYMLSYACHVAQPTHACHSELLFRNMLKWHGNICSQWKAKMHVCLEVARPQSQSYECTMALGVVKHTQASHLSAMKSLHE